MSSPNRKVYQMGDMSIREFFSAPTRYLAESINKESEFEKPYLDEDRGKMHADFPWPDWPPFPDLPPFPDIPPGPIPGLTLCGITCYEPGGGDCTEPIWCHPSIWCGADMSCNLCSWTVEGATTGYTWKHIVDGVPSKTRGIEIWIDENLLTEGKALIHAQMKDPCGNLCGKDLEVTCKVCPPDVVMTWDSVLSDTEIVQDGDADVYVEDGLGPYTWSVAGTGFSIPATTTGVHNVLSADATACGTATITVTDFCEESKTGYVKCTAGKWSNICEDINTASCYGWPTNPPPDTYHYIDNKKITIEQRCLYSGSGNCIFGSCGGFDSSNYIPTWHCFAYGAVDCETLVGAGYTCTPGITSECCGLNLGIIVDEWVCP